MLGFLLQNKHSFIELDTYKINVSKFDLATVAINRSSMCK